MESSIFKTVFFQIIKNDFILLNQYSVSKIEMFDVDITILYGEEDYQVKNDIKARKKYTSKKVYLISYKEGHFFINKYSNKLFLDISKKLLN